MVADILGTINCVAQGDDAACVGGDDFAGASLDLDPTHVEGVVGILC